MRKTIYCSLLLLFICSCRKDTPKDPIENTNKLAGNHSWEGIKTLLKIINNGSDTIIDTVEPVQFEHSIVVINNDKIYFIDTMVSTSINKSSKTIIYTNENIDSYPFRYRIDTLIFNYSNSSIEFKSFSKNDYRIYKLNIFSLK